MARALTAGMLAQLSLGRVYPIVLVEIDFISGPAYFWMGAGTIVWNSITWTGVGSLGKITPLTEDTSMSALGCTLSLSGIPSNLVLQCLGEIRQYKLAKIYFGFLDSAGAVIVDPYQAFSGRLDVPSVDEGGDTSTISITVESRLIDLQRSKERRLTHEDQQLDFGQILALATVVRAGGVVTATTSGLHGYDLVGQNATIAGVLDASFNGTFAIVSFVGGGHGFTYNQAGADASSTGGTCVVPDLGLQFVPTVQDWNGTWGKGGSVPTNAGGGGGQSTGGGGGGGYGKVATA